MPGCDSSHLASLARCLTRQPRHARSCWASPRLATLSSAESALRYRSALFKCAWCARNSVSSAELPSPTWEASIWAAGATATPHAADRHLRQPTRRRRVPRPSCASSCPAALPLAARLSLLPPAIAWAALNPPLPDLSVCICESCGTQPHCSSPAWGWSARMSAVQPTQMRCCHALWRFQSHHGSAEECGVRHEQREHRWQTANVVLQLPLLVSCVLGCLSGLH